MERFVECPMCNGLGDSTHGEVCEFCDGEGHIVELGDEKHWDEEMYLDPEDC